MVEQLLTMVAIFAGFALVVVSLILPRLVRGKKTGEDEPLLGAGSQEELRALERIEDGTLHLEELSRELFGRLDTRTRVLIRLIEEAEIRAKELKSILEQDGRSV